ncbi:MAG: peptide chain release factor N(5)-glutamine methyltransferase [Gammaproteobacteria bacterium]|nr:peptide chain release factor N(5)-glutamine methyltransferase [Gammaproteobacteria bacterium]
MNVSELLNESISRLTPFFDTARLDAEVLFSFGLGWQRTHLITRDTEQLSEEQVETVNKLISRRVNGEPVAYITGEQEFWSLPLMVNASTLIPRPETERLVEVALEYLPANESKRVLDLGTGSGAIVLALALERPANTYVAVDFSEDALKVAQHNAAKLKISGITFHQASWFSKLDNQKFDLIVSNPPYIESDDEHLSRGDVAAEPMTALASGIDGLDDLRLIIKQAPDFLNASGWIMLEHGWNQAENVRSILIDNGYNNVQSIKDFSNIERLTIAQYSSE